MASIAAHHAEWMSLVDVSGPFLSIGVLKEALPNGLIAHDAHIAAELRAALDQWADPTVLGRPSTDADAVQRAFIRFVLHEVLSFDEDVLVWEPAVTSGFMAEIKPHGVQLTPNAVLLDHGELRMLVSVVDPGSSPDQASSSDAWPASPQERMAEHLKTLNCRLGLVTDGEQWTLVSWQAGENPGFATWWASLWREEQLTLQAFRTLLGQNRFLSMPDDETLAGLLDRSAEDHREVTTKLGKQTLDAVEILIRTIDQIDRDRGGELLADVPVAELYDAAVTVMMRLIFLFFAEENDLLPTTEPLYNEQYAASTLRSQLQQAAEDHSEEVLETTHDGWPRLLATWRGVYAGIEHSDMVLPPYGGSLFDPDRYPFLEGRHPKTTWIDEEADPLPIDNRTVLHLLNALQTLEEKGHRRKLSFRALDVEQIGHVYEGMLDHTAARASGWVLGLSGSGGKQPEIELDEVEALDTDTSLLALLKEKTGRGTATNRKWMADASADAAMEKFGTTWLPAFGGDVVAAKRAHQFAKLIRPNSAGVPTVFQPSSVYVADSSHRGATGAHYTPRVLTEEMVKYTLDPLIYIQAENQPAGTSLSIRTPDEILSLRICDPACGSGAFLVQACRYLAEALVESRYVNGELTSAPGQDDFTAARREIVERCLHGVDLNPMACEMAKLSLWLVTLAKDQPFSFLDHAIRCGDSLLGITDLEQLINFHINPETGRTLHHGSLFSIENAVDERVEKAAALIEQIASTPSRDIRATHLKSQLDGQVRDVLDELRAIGDVVVSTYLSTPDDRTYDAHMLDLAASAAERLQDGGVDNTKPQHASSSSPGRLFHWPLEFPQVFISDEGRGFNAIVANPPFMGGSGISGSHGGNYRRFLVEVVADGIRGNADLVAYFFLRSASLTSGAGKLGLVATNTIAQGDTRKIGLDQLVRAKWNIMRAVKSAPWPGVASLEISKVWLSATPSDAVLDGHPVNEVTTSLNPKTRVSGRPRKLISKDNHSFIGSYLLGLGFTMPPDDALRLIDQEPKNAEVLRPYLNGQDLNSRPNQSASRWVINFLDWPIDRAKEYPDCFEIVERDVRPERQRTNDDGSYALDPPLRNRFWIHKRRCPSLYAAIEDLDRVLVLTRVSNTVQPAWVPTGGVFSDQTVVFAYDDDAHFGLLSSGFHWWWATMKASTLGKGTRYTVSDCFETFAQPELTSYIAEAGAELDDVRGKFMLDHELGLTKFYNRVHDPRDHDTDIQHLREIHVSLDNAVRDAYGWADLDLDHGFHDTEKGVRYTFGPQARTEVLDRLLELNFNCYIDEVKQGHHGNIPTPQLITDADGSLRMVESK